MPGESDLGALSFRIVGDLSALTKAKAQLKALQEQAAQGIQLDVTQSGAAAAAPGPTMQSARSATTPTDAVPLTPQAQRSALADQIAAVQQQRAVEMAGMVDSPQDIATRQMAAASARDAEAQRMAAWEAKQAAVAQRSAALREQTILGMPPAMDQETLQAQREMTATIRRA